jgi:predicted nucleic acid-binding protein
MIVLDTNVVSELMKLRPAPEVGAWITRQPRERLVTTTATQAEVLYGALLLAPGSKRSELLRQAQGLFDEDFRGRVLVFDRNAARHFAEIASDRRRQGRPIGVMDAQIAAIARSHDAAVATRDVDDLAGCGVELINPWSA